MRKKYFLILTTSLLILLTLFPLLSVKAGTNVIFISDNGTGDGSTPESPLGPGSSYATESTTAWQYSAVNLAIEKLKKTGGTIVLVGPTTIRYGKQPASDAKSCSDSPISINLLDSSLSFTFTSVWNGVDYREKNDAALIIARTKTQAISLEMHCSSRWQDITIRSTNETGTSCTDRNYLIAARGYPTYFGLGVVTEAFLGGEKLAETPENAKYFPLVCGGSRYANFSGNTNLTVYSGTWQYVCGASSAFASGTLNDQYGHLTGSANLIFGGTAKTLTGLGGGTYSNGGSLSGDATVTITGGTVYGDIDAGGHGGFSSTDSKAKIIITGGNFTNVNSINDYAGEAIHNAPAESVLDITGIKAYEGKSPMERALAIYQSVTVFDRILFPDGTESSRKISDHSLPDEVTERLAATPTSRKDYRDALEGILDGKKEKKVTDLIRMLTPATPVENGFDTAINTDALRERTIDYFVAQSQVEWVAPSTMDYSKEKSYTTKLIYEKGKTYYGLPYTSSRHPGACIQEFLDNLDGNKVYTGPIPYNQLVGGDCGSMRRAWAWGGALTNYGMTYSDYDIFESPSAKTKGVIVPVGDYDFSHYDYYQSTADCILAHNTPEQIYEAYACLQAADLIGHRFWLSGAVEQHVRLIVEDAVTVRTVDGRISPAKSYVTFSEQTSTIREIDGKLTTWALNTKVSFSRLYSEGYVPLTTVTLASGKVTVPEMMFDTQFKTGKNLIGYGKITSNYNIFMVDAVFTDSTGKTVSSVRIYPYGLTCDLSTDTRIRAAYSALPTGPHYTYTLTATIGPGTKKLTEISFYK